MVLVLVALILAIVAMATNWWTLSMSVTGVSMNLNFGLRTACVDAGSLGSQCGGYDGAPSGIASAVNISFILVLLGLILAILALVLILAGRSRPKLRMAVLLIGLIGSIMLLIAPIYFMATWPGAINDFINSLVPGGLPAGTSLVSGFFGSTTFGPANVTYGGSIGWIMCIVAFVLLLIGSLIAASGMKAQPAPMAPMPPM